MTRDGYTTILVTEETHQGLQLIVENDDDYNSYGEVVGTMLKAYHNPDDPELEERVHKHTPEPPEKE